MMNYYFSNLNEFCSDQEERMREKKWNSLSPSNPDPIIQLINTEQKKSRKRSTV